MLRTIKIGAIVALTSVFGAQAASAQTADAQTADAQTLTWGIFRENAADISESLRNCWTQAMVSGQTINGELMEQNLTERKAQFDLQSLARRGLCAAERSSTSWSARAQGHRGRGDSDDGGWRNGGGTGSDWSHATRSDDTSN
jgi:hypothetical protein